jgi:hypothetical protein
MGIIVEDPFINAGRERLLIFFDAGKSSSAA